MIGETKKCHTYRKKNKTNINIRTHIHTDTYIVYLTLNRNTLEKYKINTETVT